MRDPLNPGIVRGTDILQDDAEDRATKTTDDPRPFWQRLLTSLRPSVTVGKDIKTGGRNETVQVKGHVDF